MTLPDQPAPYEPIRWAPKVSQAKIWKIYRNDAEGTLDEDLLNDVGWRLLQRCRSIWLATRRMVECPRCGIPFGLTESEPWHILPGPHVCPTPSCGWQTTSVEWHNSWRHRDLLGAAVMPALEAYLKDYLAAINPQQQMLAIDMLIHAFHTSLRDGMPGRSIANNLIEGSHIQVLDLLDRLYAVPGGADKNQWRSDVQTMHRRRQGK